VSDDRLYRFAREMRGDPTLGERVLWSELRARRLGAKFRRQVPIGPFIADFVCFERRMIVEVDGDTHDDRTRDRARDRWFHDNRWFVLRFWDTQVINDIDDVLDTIHLALTDPSSVQDPLNEQSG
jgi:very-short-patch-repair endonuclease